MGTKDRCDSCDKEGRTSRHVIGLGRRQRAVWLCDECSTPVAALWARTTPSRLRRRDALLDRLVDVDDDRA